jgi:hypothetical protein
MPAVCHNLTCDFTYVEAVGQVSSFTFDKTSLKLQLTGEKLPSSLSQISNVNFAKSLCKVDNATLSATNIECTLVNAPTCGSF